MSKPFASHGTNGNGVSKFKAKGPYEGTRGGTYWITDSGDKTYTQPSPDAKSGDTKTDKHRKKNQSLLARVAEVPGKLLEKAGAFISKKYKEYGPVGTALVLAGMIALLPVPVPGTSLLPIAIAERIVRWKHPERAHSEFEEFTADELAAMIRESIEELYRDAGEEPPVLDSEELLLTAEEMLSNGDGSEWTDFAGVKWTPHQLKDGTQGYISEGGQVRKSLPKGAAAQDKAPQAAQSKIAPDEIPLRFGTPLKAEHIERSLKEPEFAAALRDTIDTPLGKEKFDALIAKHKGQSVSTKPESPKVEPPKPAPVVKPSVKGKSFANVEAAETHFSEKHRTNLKQGKLTEKEFLEASTAIDGEFTRMSGEYKAVRDTIKKRGKRERALELGRDFSDNTLGKYTYGAGIEIAKTPIDSKAVPTFGGHTVGSDLATTVRHEFGHEVYNETLSSGKRNEFGAKFGKYVGTSTISRYGGTNISELFSESFSAYTSPNYKRGTLPPELESWLDKNVKG